MSAKTTSEAPGGSVRPGLSVRPEKIVRLGWVWEELRTRPRDVALVAALTLLAPVVALLLPLRIRGRTEAILGEGDLLALSLELGIVLAIIAASVLLTMLRRYLMVRLCLGIVTDLRLRLYTHVTSLAPRQMQAAEGGQIANAFTADLTAIHVALKQLLGSLIPGLFLALVFTAALFWFSWTLALLLALVIGPLFLLTSFFARRIHRAAHAVQASQSALLGELSETLAGPKEIKLFRLESLLVDRYDDLNLDSYRATLRRDLLSELHPLSVSLVVAFAVAAVVLVAATFIANGWVAAGDLAGFVVCVGLLYPQVQEVSKAIGPTMQLFAGRERIDRLLDLPPEPLGTTGGPVPSDGSISMRGVSFAYPGGGAAIRGLDLDIADGERVAIVGPSGAGKSTLLELLPRFNDADAGEILIGGVPIGDIPLGDLRARIGLVLQTPFLFRASLRDNLAAGQTGLSDARIREVARAARVDEFAEALPQGYDTLIDPGGANLSVGQRQRVAIARVLLRDPPILVLDEPTSALDVGSEAHVAEAIRSAAEGRTTIIVAHRLSTVRDVDRLAVMDEGRIVEQGPHAELIARGGLYARLHAQFEGVAAAH